MSMRAGGFRLVLLIIIIGGLFIALPAQGTQFAGGKGLTMVQFPTVLTPGSLSITFHTRAFVKSLPAYTQADGTEVPSYTLSNGTGALSFDFGFTKHLEIGFTQILYQDLNASAAQDNYKVKEQIPDDSYLRFKVGGFPFTIGNAYFKFGILNQLRYRSGRVSNVILEPYSGNGIEWEVDALLSYYTNPLYEDNAPAFHLNLGYVNYNDAGLDTSVFEASQSVVYGLAGVYPTRHFDFFLEQHGNLFVKDPLENAYSRVSNLWVTPGLRFKMFYGLSATLAMDVLLWKDLSSSDYDAWRTMHGLPDEYPYYPEWRVNGAITICPSTMFYREPTFSKVGDPLSTRKLLRERKSLFEWVVDEQEGMEYIDIELEKIKAERKKAEQELEKLKQDLGKP